MDVSDFEFGVLFGVADEIYDQCWPGGGRVVLDDLDQDIVNMAKETARKLGAGWPPYLPELEELSNDRSNNVRRG